MPVLIDEQANEFVYRYETAKHTKYLFRIQNLKDRDSNPICRVSYFDRNQWNFLIERKNCSRNYIVKLSVALLKALPEKVSSVES